MIKITSNQNSLIKEVKSLKTRKYRDEKKMFFIEGTRFVEEAVKENADVVRVFVAEGQLNSSNEYVLRLLTLIKANGYETVVLPDRLFKEITDTETPQGFLAVIKSKQYFLNDIAGMNNLYIILESIQDPGNMGTIIRTADAAGIDGVILSKGCVDVYNPKVLRATMGSIFRMPVYYTQSVVETIKFLNSKKIKVCAAHLKGNQSYFDLDMRCNTAILIGNEANGISDESASNANSLVKIPMLGRAESLNASVAASILMYETVRQRLSM